MNRIGRRTIYAMLVIVVLLVIWADSCLARAGVDWMACSGSLPPPRVSHFKT